MSHWELLAPAGNLAKMETAFAHGADAVYLGVPDFSLRVRINDFDLAGVKRAVECAHRQGKRTYVTLNIFAHQKHLAKLASHLVSLKKIKPDGLIISDPGIIALVKKYWPQAEIHLSTQANCTNSEAAKFWAKAGVKRIILGREVTLKEIAEIHKAVPQVELEYFVHGAMCMAYSGRCFLSKLFIGRSGNLGDCAQPCRWSYDVSRYLMKAEGHEEELELVEEQHGSYLLNSYDLCLIRHLKELAAAGVTSFKIEGRAKSVYYQAVVCGAYRRALDFLSSRPRVAAWKKETDFLFQELESKLVHRGYTEGFLLGGGAGQNIAASHQASAWEFCGQVLEVIKDGSNCLVHCLVHNTISAAKEIEIVGPGYDIIKVRPAYFRDFKTGQKINEAHGGTGEKIILELAGRYSNISALSVMRQKIKR